MKNKLRIAVFIFVSCATLSKAQLLIDEYLKAPPVYKTIGTANDKVSQPRDLDFKPGTYELWVLNNGTSSSQGSGTVHFFSAGKPDQTTRYIKDSHSSHFLRMGSAIAFGDNGFWGNSNETNNGGNNFAGPALWTSDLKVYGQVNQNNNLLGSHSDMLHQSPYAMGIAHEKDNVYWVFDGHSGNICRYDFAKPHPYGEDDHSDGKVHRYTDITVKRLANIPSHMVLDKESGWLYVVDGGNKRVFRFNITTGSKTGTLKATNEPLAAYEKWEGAKMEVLVNAGITTPCGIDFSNGRLIVSDHENGDIIIYNTTGAAIVEMGRLKTGEKGIMGVKIGPDGKIWYVNNVKSTVVRIDPGISTSVSGPAAYQGIRVFPNPSKGEFSIHYNLHVAPNEKVKINIHDAQGRLVHAMEEDAQEGGNYMPVKKTLSPGIYFIRVHAGGSDYFKKISIL